MGVVVMKKINGFAGKYLDVDLGSGKIGTHALDPLLLRSYIGGAGLACRMLFDFQKAGTEPLSSEAVLAFATGPLTDPAVPGGGSLEICGRSPLTGGWSESRLGTDAGIALRHAGFDLCFVRGASPKPVALVVDNEEVRLIDVVQCKGKTSSEKERIVAGLLEPGFEILSIGPAGENMVPFSAVMLGHRAAGRCGMGAVMGAKNLLAVAIRGKGRIKKANPGKWAAGIRQAHSKVRQNPVSPEFTKGGTMGGMPYCDASGDFPSKNWQSNSCGMGQDIHDRFYQRNFVNAVGCYRGCPVRCGRKVAVPDGPWSTPVHDGGEYESISAFTAFVGGDNVDVAVRASYLCNELGLDTISAGGVIAFAMECAEKGLIPTDPEDGIRLEWGNAESLPTLVECIAQRKGIGDLLSLGVRAMAARLGPEALDGAIHVKGLEGPAHDPRSGKLLALTYGTNNRGMCHIHPLEAKAFDRDKVSFGLEKYGLPDPETVEAWSENNKGRIAAVLQDYGVLFEMFATCKFYGYCGLELDDYASLLAATTGWDIDGEELLKAGERVNTLQRLFNLREGFTAADDMIPDRICRVPAFGRYSGQPGCAIQDYRSMLTDYYRARGWSTEGVPLPEKAVELGLGTDLPHITA